MTWKFSIGPDTEPQHYPVLYSGIYWHCVVFTFVFLSIFNGTTHKKFASGKIRFRTFCYFVQYSCIIFFYLLKFVCYKILHYAAFIACFCTKCKTVWFAFVAKPYKEGGVRHNFEELQSYFLGVFFLPGKGKELHN
jgi:hypothetical protein